MKTAFVAPLESLRWFLYKSFRFFASIQLAIFLLLSLMIALAAGTFIESLDGTDTARMVIYESPWFTLLLLLLAINVAAAAIDRYPWKKKHTGFVITHLGILILLFGSYLTQKLMIDGQMIITQGDEEFRLTFSEPILYISENSQGEERLVNLPRKAYPWHGKRPLFKMVSRQGTPLTLYLRAYYPKSRPHEHLASSKEGPAGLQMTLQNSFVHESLTLVEGDPSRSQVPLGPAQVTLSRDRLREPQTRENILGKGSLEFQFDKTTYRVALPEKLSPAAVFKIEGTPYEIEIKDVFQNAMVAGRDLVEQKSGEKNPQGPGENPAIRFFLRGDGVQEFHTAFAKYPDFPTLHGMKPSKTGARIFYRLPGAGSSFSDANHELRFIPSEEGLIYQVQDKSGLRTGKAPVGQEVAVGWMDFRFKVQEYYPHARFERSYTPESNTATGESIVPSLQLEAETPAGSKFFWLGQGNKERIEAEGFDSEIFYGQKMAPAGFRIGLREFRVKNYPGTNNPASYESDVTLRDDAKGVVKETTISMNNPLLYNGYRIYQAGYNLSEGKPPVSILSVGRDPGVPYKYAGTIVMVAGIIIMYYTRKFSTGAGKI